MKKKVYRKIVNAIFGECGLLKEEDSTKFHLNMQKFITKHEKLMKFDYFKSFVAKIVSNYDNSHIVSHGSTVLNTTNNDAGNCIHKGAKLGVVPVACAPPRALKLYT